MNQEQTIHQYPWSNPSREQSVALAEKIKDYAEQINPGSGANYIITYNGLAIDKGDRGYRHPLWPSTIFWDIDGVKQAIRDAKSMLDWKHLSHEEREESRARANAFAWDAKHFDTRPALFDVLILVSTAERAYHLIEQGIAPDHEDAKYASEGPWDEGISIWPDLRHDPKKKHMRWPIDYRWLQTYVVHGGSEGYWLHVDQIKWENGGTPEEVTHHTHLIMGKSLGATWQQCYESAGRIAYMLGA